VRRQRKLSWETDEEGKTVAVADEQLAPEFERVDPFRFYPEPGIAKVSDGYCFEHHPLTRMALSELLGVPGYDDDAIRELLKIGNGQSWINSDVDHEKDELERKHSTEQRPTEIYDALEFWGKVSGKMLLEWGLTEEEVSDSAKEYDANVWIVGNFVIKAILNYDPLGEKPYAVTSFIKSPGAFWVKVYRRLSKMCRAYAMRLRVRWLITWASLLALKLRLTLSVSPLMKILRRCTRGASGRYSMTRSVVPPLLCVLTSLMIILLR